MKPSAGAAHLGRILLVLFALHPAADRVWALDPDRALYQLHHTAWTAEDGAPSQVSAMVQTTDGCLWIGSARGLYKFDGIAFERFQPTGDQGLPSYNVYALAATPDSGLWISFRPSGLGFLQPGEFRSFTRAEDIPDGPVFELACDLDGRVWAATLSGLELRQDESWSPVGPEWGIPRERIWCLFVDRAGTLWVATGRRLYSLARGTDAFQDEGLHDAGQVREMAETAEGRPWLCGSRLIPAPGSPASGPVSPLDESGCASFVFDRDGGLWASLSSGGLRRVASPRHDGPASRPRPVVETFGEPEGLSGTRALLLEDREGDIWVGTEKGIDRLRHNHLVPVRQPPNYSALLLVARENGDVWVATSRSRAALQVRNRDIHDLGILPRISSHCRDTRGVDWWGSSDGLWRQSGDTLRHHPLPRGMGREWIWELFPSDVPGAVWASIGDHGLRHFHDGTWSDRRPPSGLPDRGPSASFRLGDGRTWLGYTGDRAFLLDGETALEFSGRDGLGIGRIRVIRGRGPHYWFGGELGLSLFQDGRFSTIRTIGGGVLGTVSGIVETDSGDLWLNELEGIVHISAEGVRSVLADTAHAVAFRRFDSANGLPGGGQMNWTNSTAVEAADGRLWFATDDGLAWVHPERLRLNLIPPPITIRAIRTDRRTYAVTEEPRLPPHTDDLWIDFAAISLSAPELIRYRYRLVGDTEEWRDAGPRRTATFARLRPGRYRFEVRAANGDGQWATTPASVAFSIAPAFHQTAWFMAALAVTAALGLWAIHRLRLRAVAARLEQSHRERVAERLRIAHELHDTLLQGVLSASMQLHVIAEESPAQAPTRGRVRGLQDLLDQVIREARIAVEGLRSPDSEDGTGPEKALRRIREEGIHAYRGDFNVTTNGVSKAWDPNARDEAYWILREAVLNAFRHSDSTQVLVETEYHPGGFHARVSDNGRGMEAATLESGRRGHWGLPGMRERSKRLGAALTVRSRIGIGTEVELRIPGSVAFSDRRPRVSWRNLVRRFGGERRHE
jgi:signal transduction histidine kinase